MRTRLIATSIALAGSLLAAQTQAASPSDAAFLKAAAQSGAAEIEASRLAQAQALQPELKRFADAMVAEHTQVAGELQALAERKQVRLPEGPSPRQKAELQRIGSARGDQFDTQYTQRFGLRAHREAVRLFERASRQARDPEVRAWAEKTLPALQHHLEMAQALAAPSASAPDR